MNLRDVWRSDAALRAFRLLGAILLIQLAYWFVLEPLLDMRPAPPPGLVNPYDMQAATLAGPDQAGLATADFKPVEAPWSGCCDPAYYAVRFAFDLDEVPPQGLGLAPVVDADNLLILVNGALVFSRGSMDLRRPSFTRMRHILTVSPALLHSGRNEVSYILVRSSMPYADVNRAPFIAPLDQLQASHGYRQILMNQYMLISATLGGTLALLSFMVMARAERKALFFWMGVMLAAWCLRSGLQLLEVFPGPPTLRTLTFQPLEALLALCWLNIADQWSERPWRRLMPVSVALFIGVQVVSLWLSLALPPPTGFDRSSELQYYTAMALSLAAAGRFLMHIVRHPGGRIFEAALFALMISLVAMDSLREILTQRPGASLNVSLPILLVVFGLVFVGRNVRLFRSTQEINQMLSSRLIEREQEIAATYAERQAMARQQVLHAERRRIMRDMHDGMGGRLMSLAAQLRGPGRLSRKDMAVDVLEAIDELRLIIDSLDTAGDDLGMALGAFRARMDPRLRAAGIEPEWDIDEVAAGADLSADDVLEVFRILQEVCANMLRHAGAKAFSVRLVASDGAIELTATDDGVGFVEGAREGRGLANIRDRARRLGGDVSWTRLASRTAFQLRLPGRL